MRTELKSVTSVRTISLAFLWLFLITGVLNGQIYNFKNYGAEYNIPDRFIYTINQSDNGFLWIGTGSGLARFDGFNYYPVSYPDASSEAAQGRIPSVSLKAGNGVLWFGCSDGSVFYASDNKLIPVKIENSRSIVQILEAPDKNILIFTQGNTIYSINPKNEGIKKFTVADDQVIFSASFTGSGDLLIGTQGNILICSLGADTVSVKSNIEGFGYSGITTIRMTHDSTRFLIGTEDEGLYLLRIAGKITSMTPVQCHPDWMSLRVKSVFEDPENNIWVSTFGTGVIQFRFSDDYVKAENVRFFNSGTGLSNNSNDIKIVFQDLEGNFWFGSYGNYLYFLRSYSFSYYTPGKNSQENNIIYVNRLNDNYILGTQTGFHIFNPSTGKAESFTSLTASVGNKQITCYHIDSENNIWIGTEGNGLYLRKPSGAVALFYRNGDSGADNINDVEIDDQNIWLATTNGVIVLDKKSRSEKKKFDITDGLPPKSINKILFSPSGNAYIAGESDRLTMIDNTFNVSSGQGVMNGNTINKVLSFSEGRNGEIWASTSGNGIFRIMNDTVSSVSLTNGLMSNSCYSILADSENEVWVGHSQGFSRYNPETGIVAVYGSDYAKTGTCNTNAIFESPDKKIFIGTTEGLIIYDRKLDKENNSPPLNNITSIVINSGGRDSVYQYQPSIVLPYKHYRITINYCGIRFRAPDKIYYSTYLDGYDPAWSKMSPTREAPYTLTDGKYRFNLVSVNEIGLSQESPLSFEIVIHKPWWRQWWSIIAGVLIVSYVIMVFIKRREKAQKEIQEYLEKELAARTSIVMKQKGEIELQNIEITDSINYAKRIQSSILPDITKLKDSFKDAFILFHPRDIVSGDFYWFDKLSDDRFILVCADSTGHGVPGAFMSMIGSTLLQDIVTRKGISKPSEILTLLDKQIFSTLNQNVELGVSNDGMDMVVCEFNIKTRHIRFASAMRPVIIVMDGESYYIKGNRSSVGGESVMAKYFDDQEYYLSEGDTVYLFSDGLPDQFGGTDGKKMKIARLKRKIEEISKMPMDQQKEAMSTFYFEWRGTYDQVDDVLLMAVRV